jgi:hypothetical protein
MLRRVVFVALLAMSLTSSAGCGINWLGDQSVCVDPADALSCPIPPQATDPPTNPPPDPPSTPTPLAPGCVDNAVLLFPSPAANTVPSNYANTIYLSVPARETPGPFLAVYVGQTDPATNKAQFETGTPLQLVTAPPSYVAPPPPGYAGVYASSNLPLMPTWGTGISLLDTRTPRVCDFFTFATLNVKDAARAPRRSLRGGS